MNKTTHWIALTSLLLSASVAAADSALRIHVEGTDDASQQVPVRVQLNSPDTLQGVRLVHLIADDGSHVVGQLTSQSLLSPNDSRELHFVLPSINKGQKKSFTVHAFKTGQPTAGMFSWKDTAGAHVDLVFDNRPILRYMYAALDNSSPAEREKTYKVFHHVFDPDGQQIVTKGAGGKFSHHRGLFYGFNRISYGSQAADIWHCNKGESQQHREVVQAEAGPVLGRHRLAIDWHGRDGEVFANELREMTVYNVPGGQLIEFASRLTSLVPSLTLDGDPQHAGFQFRASQEVAAKTNKQTYYLRPDGRGQPGETRNWIIVASPSMLICRGMLSLSFSAASDSPAATWIAPTIRNRHAIASAITDGSDRISNTPSVPINLSN